MHPSQCPSSNIWDGKKRRKLQLATLFNHESLLSLWLWKAINSVVPESSLIEIQHDG